MKFILCFFMVIGVLLSACQGKEELYYPKIDVELTRPSVVNSYSYGDVVVVKGEVVAESDIKLVEVSIANDSFVPVGESKEFYPEGKSYTLDTTLEFTDPDLESGEYLVQFKVHAGDHFQRDYQIINFQQASLTLEGWFYGNSSEGKTHLYEREGNDLIVFKDWDFETTFGKTIPELGRFVLADPSGLRTYDYIEENMIWEKSALEILPTSQIDLIASYNEEIYCVAEKQQIRKIANGVAFTGNFQIEEGFKATVVTPFENQVFTAQESVVGDQKRMVVYQDNTQAIQHSLLTSPYGKIQAFFQRTDRFFYVLTEKDGNDRLYQYDLDANLMDLVGEWPSISGKYFLQHNSSDFFVVTDKQIYRYSKSSNTLDLLSSVNFSIENISFVRETADLFLMGNNQLVQHNLETNNRIQTTNTTEVIHFVIPRYNK